MNRLLALTFALALPAASHADDWPQFLGPKGDSHYSGKPLPIEFGPGKNQIWKVAVPGKAWSSPIVAGGKVFLTTAVPKDVGNGVEHSLRAMAFDANDGKTLWDVEVFVEPPTAPKIHGKNSHASPTPLFDGERIYVHFGHLGTAALTTDGKIVWKNTELGYAPVHGNGGSPIFAGGNLIIAADGSDKQFLAALEPATGKVRWRTPRNHPQVQRKFSFATPALITHEGKEQIISPASDAVHAIDPKTGKELWRVTFIGWSLIVKPVYGDGLIFASTGYMTPQLLAIKPDGTGDVTKSNVAWTMKRGAPNTPTPVLIGSELYVLSDGGRLTCCDAKTGKEYYQELIPGSYSASMLVADGKIYATNESGVSTVVKAGKEFEVLSKADFGEPTFASFAGADGSLFVRTEKYLYRFQGK